MADRIRGLETTVQVVVNGVLQAGSFAKCETFKWEPMQDLPETDFLGEAESDPDFRHDGYRFNFTINEKDNFAVDNVLVPLVSAHTSGLPLPDVTLVFIKKYRDPSIPVKTLVFQKVKLKMDSQDVSGRKDYVKTSFSGRCRKMKVV